MSCTPPDSVSFQSQSPDEQLQSTLDGLDQLLPENSFDALDADTADLLAEHLRSLHARLRMRHAAGRLASSTENDSLPPEYAREQTRLTDECVDVLGMLDRIIRWVDSIADRTVEDQEVFVLRVREVVAVLRRHLAEEDRLFYLAIWRDTGGEG